MLSAHRQESIAPLSLDGVGSQNSHLFHKHSLRQLYCSWLSLVVHQQAS